MAESLDPLARLFAPDATGVIRFYDDPAGFIRNCIIWKPGTGPADYQLRAAKALVDHERLAIRGPRGLGKTSWLSWMILWFALTRDAAQDNWKCIVTAAVWRQLKDYLWAEVERVWTPRLNWEEIGREPFRTQEMMREELRLRFGSVTLAVAADSAKIEGSHADQILFGFDEAKAIEDSTFDSAEGTFAHAGAGEGMDAYVVASSTPGVPMGRFYDICSGAKGLEHWHHFPVKLKEVLAAGRISKSWVDRMEALYGRDSSWFQNHVLGEFARESADGVIRQSNLEECHERWLALGLPRAVREARDFNIPRLDGLGPLTAVGIDLGAGLDRTCYALRYGPVIGALILRPQERDTTKPEAEIEALLRSAEHHPIGIIDADGLGIPVYNRLARKDLAIRPFKASEGGSGSTRYGMYGFADTRAAAWWNAREMMERESGIDLAIPPEEQLTADLLAPRYEIRNEKIVLESKKDIRKRLKRSTDLADALVMALWTRRMGEGMSAPQFAEMPGESRWGVLRPGRATGLAGSVTA